MNRPLAIVYLTIMNMDVYRRLQKHLNHHPIPFPETKTGIEIKLLKSLFTEQEAEIALQLSTLLERPTKIFNRIPKNGTSIEQLEDMLKIMHKKGSIRAVQDRKNEGNFLYSKMPLAVGMF